MADKSKNNAPAEEPVENAPQADDSSILTKSVGGEVAHDEHSGFHNYAGGTIIERGAVPIPWYYWAVGVTLIVILFGGFLFYSGNKFIPQGTSDTEVAALSTDMAKQASATALTSPYMIDMYELPRPGGQNLQQAISAGTDVYQSYCIGCHGPNQDGAGPNSTALDPKPRNLRDQPFIQSMSYQRAWTSIHKGVPGTAMPRWENTLNDDQIRDVICYVFSLTAPTDPKTGQFIRPSQSDLAPQQVVPAAQ